MTNHCCGCNNTQSVLHAPVMEDTPAAAGNGIRELAGDELALVSGGDIGGGGGSFGSGPFGVRRPLRFLAWKLQLDEAQVESLATILNELKTERAQAAVDERRTLTAYADAVAGETFDEARAGEVAAQRVKSAERLQATVAKALGRIHALLGPEQRGRLAYLIRTGALVL